MTKHCPYLSGEKTEKCPWAEFACQARKLKHVKGVSPQTVDLLLESISSATTVTKNVWKEKGMTP